MPHCVNHPYVETQKTCATCGMPFCEACLVELLGVQYCGPCRDRKLQEMQGHTTPDDAPLAGTGTVDLGGWLSAGWRIIERDVGTFVVATLLAGLLSALSCGICSGPLTCGLSMMCYRKMLYGQVDIGNVFDGFRRFLWSFLFVLMVIGVSLCIGVVFAIPVAILSAASGGEESALSALLELLINVVSSVLGLAIEAITFFALPHIAARNANPIEALAASWEVFRRNPWMFVVTAFVFNLLRGAGFLLCCIGLLFTVPWIVAAQAKAYADHFGIRGFDAA